MRGTVAVTRCSNGPQDPAIATVVPGGLLSNPILTVLVVDEPSDASMALLKSFPSLAASAVM